MSRCAYHDEGLTSFPCSCPLPDPLRASGLRSTDTLHALVGVGYFIARNADDAWALWLGSPDDPRPVEFATMEAGTGRITVDGRWPMPADRLGEAMTALRGLHDDRPGAPGWEHGARA